MTTTNGIDKLARSGVSKADGAQQPAKEVTNGHPNGHTNGCQSNKPLTFDGIAAHRARCAPMPKGLAPSVDSDMFRSPGSFNKPRAMRRDQWITRESATRTGSSLKKAARHLAQPGLISLGGGMPSSDYFPLEHIDIKVPFPPNFSEAETLESGVVRRAGKHDIREGRSLYDLEVGLNYGHGTGSAQIMRFVTEHTEVVHQPQYSDWSCCLTAGSTIALEQVFRMLCVEGDSVLTEEYSFATAIETATPLGIKLVGVKMDRHGMLADDLDLILSNWDSGQRGRKPFLVYTVPTGQNPTGATQSHDRRKALFAVAEKHDLCILEDEPYYFLQMEDYVSGHIHTATETSHSTFLRALIPSYLSMDTSGRVLRLDSFSKIIAPGTRVGWITGPTQLVDRFFRHCEISTQSPSGISQIVLYKLLEDTWGHVGFLGWLLYIRAEYTRRRDIIVAACERYLPAQVASWNAPQAGMFHWIKIDWRHHPKAGEGEGVVALQKVETAIFERAISKGVLCTLGSWFRAEKGTDTDIFLRTTFAAAPADRVGEAIRRLGEALREEFGIEEGEQFEEV